MGFLDKIKGWFNIGGVKVNITKVEDPFPRDDTVMSGDFTLTTSSDKTILNTSVEFYVEETTGEGDEEETTKSVLGHQSTDDYLINTDYPFELAAGETRELHFLITDVNVEGTIGRMKAKGGVMGALGKAASLASKLKEQGELRYFVEVTADVKGTPFDPTDKVEIHVVPGKS